MNKLFFELIQVSVGTRDELSRVPTAEEWRHIYDEANKQALTGVLMEGVKRLKGEQIPPRQMVFDWHATSQLIASENMQTNHDCVWLSKRWTKLGYRNVILKGQGNAQLYPNPLCRKPGDIDILIDAPRKEIIDYARKLFPHEEITSIEMNFPVLKTTPIELHFAASYLFDPTTNRRLQEYLQQGMKQTRIVELPDGCIEVPETEVNIVFQISHIFRHLFFEGIGLRQLVDFFYLLQSDGAEQTYTRVRAVLKEVKLVKFTSALMWVMQEVFGMKNRLILPPNEREGRFLLDEMMRAGCFGHSDDRVGNWAEMNRWERLTWGTKWSFRLIRHYPREVMWHPFYRIRQYLWRLRNGYLG